MNYFANEFIDFEENCALKCYLKQAIDDEKSLNYNLLDIRTF